MLNSVHVVAAAAVVELAPHPLVGLPLAFLSHIALDTIPHWNWHPAGSGRQVAASVADIGMATLLSLLLATQASYFWLMLMGCLLSTVPDLIQGPYYLWNWRPRWLTAFVRWESRRQKWPWMRPWMGLATQVLTLVTSIFLFFLMAW